MIKKIIFILVIGLLVSSAVNSQPQFRIHVTGGYNLPLPDLKGDILDSADQQNTYGMKMGFGFGADAKYYLGKKRNVGITLSLGYNMFSNSEDTVTYYEEIGTYGARDVKLKLNAFTVGLGVEYAFLPKGKANPFIGAEFTGHFFSGEGEFTRSGTTTTTTLKSASRFGAAIGAGVDIALSKSIGIIVGGKYHLANLIGKDSTDVTGNEFALNDKEMTIGSTTIAAKNISYIQAYLGISFFLNQPKKMVKK